MGDYMGICGSILLKIIIHFPCFNIFNRLKVTYKWGKQHNYRQI